MSDKRLEILVRQGWMLDQSVPLVIIISVDSGSGWAVEEIIITEGLVWYQPCTKWLNQFPGVPGMD